ncbi:AraC family transcriptional regulator [Paenibacillus mucilaginosus]|uniref:AraC family transcriptional regulator n=3 Tax=Paenibacillus mucilaginosus TaxID=61624 RepID=H6NBM6_9BACL|nr:AraC family transcriptional regulator [Paenibacillus mucilaginosus]AEI46177.1 transcriptional regulator (AraC/XylS family) protein [Paenibacillus mucilaginosus KNP414]AFC33795.1 AraC family transcriptional regulator [Paenibacillus mucilaginosus 3016]AFH66125.1 AraC family transcriptional regulator [Paenibacillus mucilaginosus K02]MCG7213691.1 AraC family transcriptional regulator [Paenibacillus mucilaginosus]WDM27505.1 AraC family transcriptional regulator [Paenibacillus mucilaginosus]
MKSSTPRPESYYVVSNPYPPAPPSPLTVLFSGHSQTKPGHKPGPKVVDYYLLHHILSGRGTYTCLGQTYELGPGDSFLIEPGKLVAYTADLEDPWHYRWIAFEGEQAASLLEGIGLSSRQPVVHAPRRRSIGVLFHQVQSAFRSRSLSANLKANGLLQLLLADYAEALQGEGRTLPEDTSPAAQTVQQALNYLSAQYAEPITIELMAETLGYNRAYLSTLFKQQTGVTPVTFLLRLRLDKARHLLRERPELTIEQTASSVGFQDPLYFSKQFKRQYGVSPTDYRQSLL